MAVDAKAAEQAKALVLESIPEAGEAILGESPEGASVVITGRISEKFLCVSSDWESITEAVNAAWISAASRFQKS